MPNAKRKSRSNVVSSLSSPSSSKKKTKNSTPSSSKKKTRNSTPSSSSSSSIVSSTTASFDKNPFWVIFGDADGDDDDDNNNDGGDIREDEVPPTFMVEEEDDNQQQQQQEKGENEADLVFDKMLQFTELTSRRKTTTNDGTAIDDTDVKQRRMEEETETAVHHLLGYMMGPINSENKKNSIEQKNKKAATTCFVLSEDIARLLLPWSVKCILQDAYNNKKKSSLPSSSSSVTAPVVVSSESMKFLYWKTFDRCLSFFFDRSEEKQEETGTGKGTPKSTKQSGNNNNFNSILTLSTLHKIVPIALSLALEEEAEVETVTDEISFPTTTVQNLANDCYCQLADNLYRPPFDVICDSLLPILTRDRTGEGNDKKKRNSNTVTTIWLRVTISTIRLMNSRIANANPKKSFQLLVRPKVFLDLAVVYCALLQREEDISRINKEQSEILKKIFNDLIRDGIFSLEHHMDGFRSLQLAVPVFNTMGQKEKVEVDSAAATPATTLTTKPSFRGYQEGLLTTLEGFLIVDNSTKSSSINAESISHVTPLLLDIFLEQSSKVQQQTTKKSYKKTKVVDKLGHLQFRFFSCLTGNLLKGLLKSKNDIIQTDIDVKLRVSLFAMIGRNLDLLLKYNVYQPSLGNSAEQSFLDKIGKETIEFMTAQGENENENEKQRVLHYHISFPEWECTTRILDVILRLNHTILHEQLTVILSRCLTYCSAKGSDVATVAASAKAFLVTIIATYGKLRQLDYFYMNLLDAVSVLTREEESYRLVQLLAFADDDDISRQIGTAIQESPIQQLKQIFSTVNESIVGRSDYSKDDSLPVQVTLLASSVITKLLTGLLRNVRVDSNSSNEIYPICKEIISGPITRLMEEDDDGNVNNAVILCAWSIHLKNRCEFWIGNKQIGPSDQDTFNIPLSIHRVLKDAITTVDYETGDVYKEDLDLLESLKFFSCQRIQQLHGEFYEKQRLAYASDAEQYNTSSEMSEARELVGFMLQGCYSNDRESDSKQKMRDQWVVLAGAISIWAPYAGENDINSFLNQLLQAVAIVGKSDGHRKEQIVSLLYDTSFYEIPNVSNRLGTNVISFVAENIQKILGLCDGASPQLFEIARPILHPDWESLSFTELLNVHKSRVSMTCASNHLAEMNELLLGSLQVLETINHVCIPIWEDCNDGIRTFESFQRIELICSMLLSKNGSSFLDTTAQLISELRIAASRVLGSISPQSTEKIFQKQGEDLMILLPQILKTTSICFDRSPSSGIMHRCIHSCNMLIGSIVEICMSHEENMITGLVQILDSTFHEDKAEVSQGGTHYLVLTSYAVTLLKKFRRSIDADTDTAVIDEFLRVIQKRLWIQAQKYCFESPKDSNLLFRNQSRILIAEALRLSSTCSEARTIPLSSIETKIVVKLRDLSTRDVDEFEMRSISYLIGCYAMTKPSGIVTQELTHELLVANLEGYDVFLTPLCVLARDMEPNEFDKFLDKLTSTLVKAPSKLKILHMLVLSVTNESQVEVIAKHSATIMSNCLQVMTQVARQVDVESESILEVSSLIVNMASRKDIMILRERDIALILACITSTIRVDEDCAQKQTTEAHIKAYDASFLLISFFLQRFSKQVHSCVPSLIISLNTMLQFALRESMPVASMPSCGQKFSRLCELLLPYGEVYKKHIICLIVRFVDALQGTMNATCKKSLLPGIYCLLDTIQDHETMQLNSMLDEMGRALLRSLHEGYKKIHVYHGQ